MKKSFADILVQVNSAKEKKIARKLPSWARVPGLEFPYELSLEQCSSEEAARHKLSILEPYLQRDNVSVCDLTCGMGVDSWAFSQRAAKVISYERDSTLAAATASNFHRLGTDNIEVRNAEVGPQTLLPECDIIFADPARRDNIGKKVFLLEDCSPDIRSLLPQMKEKAAVILLKLSPMADISLIADQLGSGLKEMHIVSVGGEVKELLCLIERGFEGQYRICVEEAGQEGTFSFYPEEESACRAHHADSINVGEFLHEPSAALLKSGAFKLATERFGIEKLDTSTHLYKGGAEMQSSLFKTFRIEEVLEFSSSSLKELKRRRIKADVTARNLEISSDELRKKIAALPGGHLHIFACPGCGRRLLLICSRCTA